MPAPDKLAKACDALAGRYGAEMDVKTPRQAVSLAEKLISDSFNTHHDAALNYVLLDKARALAADEGGAKVAFHAVEELAKWFQVDAIELKLETLTDAAKAPPSPQSKQELVESAIELSEAAADLDRFAEAGRAVKLAAKAVCALKHTHLTKQIAALRLEIEKLAKAHAAVKDSLAKLETDPNDAQANLAAGRYYCFDRDDWDRGLKHLAAGSDPALKRLAERERAKPDAADAQRSLGDGWWDLSRKDKGPGKTAMAGRAGYWYRRALPQLARDEKRKVELRLKEIDGKSPVEKMQFLSKLPELSIVVWNNEKDTWFRKGRNWVQQPITVNGRQSPHGLFLHPPDDGSASVT